MNKADWTNYATLAKLHFEKRHQHTVQLNINFTHVYREHVCVCTFMACNFVKYREYFDFAHFGGVRSHATVHDNTVEYTLHEETLYKHTICLHTSRSTLYSHVMSNSRVQYMHTH